jgi:hypothetical protein
MSLAIRLYPEPLRSLPFGSIGVGYTIIGTALTHPSRVFEILNLTDATVLFSLDGINDHFILPTQGFILIDCTANKTADMAGAFIAQNTSVYAKQSGVPTSGAVYVTTLYGRDI